TDFPARRAGDRLRSSGSSTPWRTSRSRSVPCFLGVPSDELRLRGDEIARREEEIEIARDIREALEALASLSEAREIPHPPTSQVLFSDLETVARALEQREAFARRVLAEQEAPRFLRAAPDATAQLVELREAQPLRVLDDHHGRRGNVDADLDHRRR